MEKYDILTLDNGKDYTISQMVEFNGKDYLLLVEVDDDENILEEKLIVEKNKDTNELVVVNDEEEYKNVSSIFTKMILQDLEMND